MHPSNNNSTIQTAYRTPVELYAKVALTKLRNPQSVCVVAHDLSRLFYEDHAICKLGGAPIEVFELKGHHLQSLWSRAESGKASQEDWIDLSRELLSMDRRLGNRLAYQRSEAHINLPLFSAVNCASKALESGESADALEALHDALKAEEQTTVLNGTILKTYYKTKDDFLGMELSAEVPTAPQLAKND